MTEDQPDEYTQDSLTPVSALAESTPASTKFKAGPAPEPARFISDQVAQILEDDGSSQPTAARTVEHGAYDITSLKPAQYNNAVHRDWIGHWTRWAFAGRRLKKGDRVLEPGCGRESMLHRHIQTNSSIIPELYVGVDLDKIDFETDRIKKAKTTCKWADFYPEFDFVTRGHELEETYGPSSFDKVVSTEVYEHVTPKLGVKYLDQIRRMMADDGELILSTPVFNGKKAANHIKEYPIDELQLILEDRGFKVVDRFGTFASYHDVKRGLAEKLTPDEYQAVMKVYERCREFMTDGLLAGMLSPFVPDHSRNNTWICVKDN